MIDYIFIWLLIYYDLVHNILAIRNPNYLNVLFKLSAKKDNTLQQKDCVQGKINITTCEHIKPPNLCIQINFRGEQT